MSYTEADLRKLLISSFDQVVASVELIYENEIIDSNSLDAIGSQLQRFNEQIGVYKFFLDKGFESPVQGQLIEENPPEVSPSPVEEEIQSAVTELEQIQAEVKEDSSVEIPGQEDQEDLIQEEQESLESVANTFVSEEFNDEGGIEAEELNQAESDLNTISSPADDSNQDDALDNLVSDGLTEEKAELNDQHKQEDKSLANRLQKQPISDLKAAIGLNQRFLFSNALFDGNMEAFNRAVNEINHLESKEMADTFLQMQIIEKYNWDLESEEALTFLDLLERRFM